jgi:F-type H+-transporting ATPase subunit b
MLDFSVTFVITIINMAVLVFILRLILFKPVTKFMAERAKRVGDSIEQSEKDRAQAKALLAQYEAQLKTAETEAEAIINTAREQAKQEAERIIAEGRIFAEETLANARKQLEKERLAAMTHFQKEAADLVVAATGRLLGRELKNEDNRKYADMLLEEIGPAGPGRE